MLKTAQYTLSLFRQLSASQGATAVSCNQLRAARLHTRTDEKWKPKIVIFDKNGTLIHFDSPWVPWVQDFSQRVEEMTGLKIKKDLLSHLDVCLFTNRVKSGVLASGTSTQIKSHVRSFLNLHGVRDEEAGEIVGKCWVDCDTSDPQYLQELANLRQLFATLTQHNIKIAVCSSDVRRATERTLGELNLMSHVSMLTCGDDGNALPKPHPNHVQHICSTLALQPRDAVVVGDTEADMLMGIQAGVGMNIGVLSGIGTRLDLVQYADLLAENVQEALPLILDPPLIEMHRAKEETNDSASTSKAHAVIFDKDGTLICFHSIWTPWAKRLVERLEEETRLHLYEGVMDALGYSHEEDKWIPGPFSEGTQAQCEEKVIDVLENKGIHTEAAKEVVKDVWQKTDDEFPHKDLKVFDNPTALFKILKENDIKVAVCTSDSRPGTTEFLESIGATPYVDLIICGDDPISIPKPSPQNAYTICEQLGVDPSRTIVVGDTMADMGMGRSAKLGATVGVLTGVGQIKDLENHADHVVHSIKDIMPLVLPKNAAQSNL